jgi:hypothetical protein
LDSTPHYTNLKKLKKYSPYVKESVFVCAVFIVPNQPARADFTRNKAVADRLPYVSGYYFVKYKKKLF